MEKSFSIRLVFAVLIASTTSFAASSTQMTFVISTNHGDVTKVADLAQLKALVKPQQITIQDPIFKEKKTYEGFPLQPLLTQLGMESTGGDEVIFHCADGYSPSSSFAKMKAGAQGYLVFREVGKTGGWSTLQQGKASITPAPYYLVWDQPDESYPWPYQLVGMEVVRFKERYSKIFPADFSVNSAPYRGFQKFKDTCLRCHSINLQGGDIGPELNYPKNVTEYWKSGTLKSFIQKVSDFRLKSKMPDFANLKSNEVEDILSYLAAMKKHKVKP